MDGDGGERETHILPAALRRIEAVLDYATVVIEHKRLAEVVPPYPVENHGFTEETSWADEYKRIFKLFEDTLRKK